MDRPRVTIHNLTSLDGRLDGFPAEVGLYYELVGALPHQAVLTGTGTMLAAAADEGIDLAGEDEESAAPEVAGEDPRPWLVVVDSAGRLTRLAWLRGQPHWRDVLVLCSSTTPPEHRRRLRRRHVEHIVTGTDHVDLAAALHTLADRYGVSAVRVDAGPTLNGALVRAGLVDEISVVLAPHLVGSSPRRPVHVVEGMDEGDARELELTSVRRLRDGHVWLRYAVRGPDSGA